MLRSAICNARSNAPALSEINMNSTLADLGIESIDVVDIVCELEKGTGEKISDLFLPHEMK